MNDLLPEILKNIPAVFATATERIRAKGGEVVWISVESYRSAVEGRFSGCELEDWWIDVEFPNCRGIVLARIVKGESRVCEWGIYHPTKESEISFSDDPQNSKKFRTALGWRS